ncbi:hypothetical protein B0A55_11627 [Friedmanniomyces simplex]|uniref:Ubiquitin-like domain-containing protein n=1 Tax=Friedmanniomyces simplex TaxID=329884 RepID=A0A4V5NCG2_9PEZI|nr:hypothetical protein B0A55_11627 [Friedmanniomyces simplex]
MAAFFTVSLPLETVAAIQRGDGLEKALQDLSLTQDVPTRVVHDIARGVVSQVNALPFVLAPKGFNVPVPAPIHTTQAYNSGCATPTPSPRLAATFGGKHTAPRPSSSQSDPFFPVRFTIHGHLMMQEQSMAAKPEDTFESIAERYASILGIPQSDITFTFEDGTKIRLHDEPSQSRVGVRLSGTQTARTLRTLGITDGTVIMAEPKMINITVRDLMMKEEKFTFYTTDCFGQLGEVYADLIRIAANKLIFTVSSRYWGTFDVDQSEKEAWGDYLHNLGIRDGDVITVKPKVDPSYDISFTIRDAMNKESSFTLKSTATVDDLGDEYELRAWMRASTLQFELEGFVFGSYPAGHGEDTIEQIGIYDGALVTVRPYEQIQQESPAQTKSSIHGGWGNGTESVGSRSDSPDFNTRKNVQRDTREQDPLAKWYDSQVVGVYGWD